jgi:hypothetical protein
MLLRLRTNTVRTEYRAFPNSQNARVITKPKLQYKDSCRITIIVVTSPLYTLHYTYIRILICILVPLDTYMYGTLRINVSRLNRHLIEWP